MTCRPHFICNIRICGTRISWSATYMGDNMLPSKTLPDFQNYLISHKLVKEKNVAFYAYWAS
jgi:hypothetical protein